MVSLLQTVTGEEVPVAMAEGGLHQMIPGTRRLGHTVSRPGIIGEVGIGHELQSGRGFPGESEVDAAFILNPTT